MVAKCTRDMGIKRFDQSAISGARFNRVVDIRRQIKGCGAGRRNGARLGANLNAHGECQAVVNGHRSNADPRAKAQHRADDGKRGDKPCQCRKDPDRILKARPPAELGLQRALAA